MIIYVLDTETTTTNFHDPNYGGKPNGHIVEFGLVRVDTERRTIGPTCHYIFDDPKATGEEWCFQESDVPFRPSMRDNIPFVDGLLAASFGGRKVTAYNVGFDRTLCERDLPKFAKAVVWAADIMEAAYMIKDIPRKVHETETGLVSWPSVQSTWDYLFPD